MRPTAWASGAVAAAAVLWTGGLAFDAPGAAAASAGLAALVGARAALFLSRTARAAEGLGVERRVERSHVRQGEPVGVATRLDLPPVPGLRVSLADLPPASAAYVPGETRAVGGWARYWVRMTLPGEAAFRGVRLEARDPFFSTVLELAADRYAGTPLTVLPSDAPDRPWPAEGTVTGERERERQSVLRGQGTRSYRPFRAGDDPALVDWKLSAKFGRYFVREPTGQAGGPPLVVVDLPPRDASAADDVLSAAAGAVGAAVAEHGTCSLLAVAGGQVVAFLDREADLAALVRQLGALAGVAPAPLFRARDPSSLRQRLRTAERSAGAPDGRLAAALRASLAGAGRSPFEQDLDRVLAAAGESDVVLYSAGAGDRSHLALLGAAVLRQGRRLRAYLPGPDPAAVADLAPYGAVEAL